MTYLQQKQAEYLCDLFTLCESWLYEALLSGGVPTAEERFTVRLQALKKACKAANVLQQPISLNQWLPAALESGRVQGLRTPLLYLPTDCLHWGWLESRLKKCSGERPALEQLAAALCADGRLSQTECVEELAAWHTLVALCLAAQLQIKETGAMAESCRTLVALLAGRRSKHEKSLLTSMKEHCDKLHRKGGEVQQLSRWGNGFSLLQLVCTAWNDRTEADGCEELLLPASVLRVQKKPDLPKAAVLWKVTAMEPGEWSRVTVDSCQWLSESPLTDVMRKLELYGEELHSDLPEEWSEETAQDKEFCLLEYCSYPGEEGSSKICMARWKNEQQVSWPNGEHPSAQPAEWFAPGGPCADLLMKKYGDCRKQQGLSAGQHYYSAEALHAFGQMVAQAGADWQQLEEQIAATAKIAVSKEAKLPQRFNLEKLFGAKPSRTDRSRFVQGLWCRWNAVSPGWSGRQTELAALHGWLQTLLQPGALWVGFAQDAFAAEASVPESFAQAVIEWGCAQYRCCPEWETAYLSYRGKRNAWVFTAKD